TWRANWVDAPQRAEVISSACCLQNTIPGGSGMLYHAYEMSHAAISPMRAAARMGQEVIRNPFNPMASTYAWRAASAALEMFINATRRYGRPAFGIEDTLVDGVEVPV